MANDGRFPPELAHAAGVRRLMQIGVTITLDDLHDMPATMTDDLFILDDAARSRGN